MDKMSLFSFFLKSLSSCQLKPLIFMSSIARLHRLILRHIMCLFPLNVKSDLVIVVLGVRIAQSV
jgi:hypothetical protein